MTYWHYTYIIQEGNSLNYGYGVQMSGLNELNFMELYSKYPQAVLLSVNAINAEQYEALNKHINKLMADGNKR